MNAFRIAGYTLTVIAAGLGLVYYPILCINELQPWTASPMVTLKYQPLWEIGMIPILILVLYLLRPKINPRRLKLYFEQSLLMLVWLMSTMGPVTMSEVKDKELYNHITWSGSCEIVGVGDGSYGSHWTRVTCPNGRSTSFESGDNLVNVALRAKTNTVQCDVHANDRITCK